MHEARYLPNTRSIAAFRFYAVGAAGTVTGYYTDADGTNIGSFSTAVPYNTGTAVDIAGGTNGLTVPALAVGAILAATGTVAYASGSAGGDLVTNVSRYPTLPTTSSTLGQVS